MLKLVDVVDCGVVVPQLPKVTKPMYPVSKTTVNDVSGNPSSVPNELPVHVQIAKLKREHQLKIYEKETEILELQKQNAETIEATFTEVNNTVMELEKKLEAKQEELVMVENVWQTRYEEAERGWTSDFEDMKSALKIKDDQIEKMRTSTVNHNNNTGVDVDKSSQYLQTELKQLKARLQERDLSFLTLTQAFNQLQESHKKEVDDLRNKQNRM